MSHGVEYPSPPRGELGGVVDVAGGCGGGGKGGPLVEVSNALRLTTTGGSPSLAAAGDALHVATIVDTLSELVAARALVGLASALCAGGA